MCIRDSSTTVKGVVLNDDGELLYSKYLPSKGNPVEIIKVFLEEVYAINPEINIVSSAVTCTSLPKRFLVPIAENLSVRSAITEEGVIG